MYMKEWCWWKWRHNIDLVLLGMKILPLHALLKLRDGDWWRKIGLLKDNLEKEETFSESNLHLWGLKGTNSFYKKRKGAKGQEVHIHRWSWIVLVRNLSQLRFSNPCWPCLGFGSSFSASIEMKKIRTRQLGENILGFWFQKCSVTIGVWWKFWRRLKWIEVWSYTSSVYGLPKVVCLLQPQVLNGNLPYTPGSSEWRSLSPNDAAGERSEIGPIVPCLSDLPWEVQMPLFLRSFQWVRNFGTGYSSCWIAGSLALDVSFSVVLLTVFLLLSPTFPWFPFSPDMSVKSQPGNTVNTCPSSMSAFSCSCSTSPVP